MSSPMHYGKYPERSQKQKIQCGILQLTQLTGHNTIDKFMSRMSKLCDLADHYTNHCIRVTGANTLTRANFSQRQVMAVISHKSIQSLAIYQRVQDDEKLLMGMKLTYVLQNPEEAQQLMLANFPGDQQQISAPLNVPMCQSTSSTCTSNCRNYPCRKSPKSTHFITKCTSWTSCLRFSE